MARVLLLGGLSLALAGCVAAEPALPYSAPAYGYYYPYGTSPYGYYPYAYVPYGYGYGYGGGYSSFGFSYRSGRERWRGHDWR
ncbi:MAG: hypothetical protein HY058_10675 [Proteobacteria bacterium]|nr:hypothetical protein [Pseudomonadota bacterium]